MTRKDGPRLIISVFVLVLFGILVLRNPNSALLVGALIAMATQATGYWLGSSKGSADKSEQIERMEEGPSGNRGDPVHVEEDRP